MNVTILKLRPVLHSQCHSDDIQDFDTRWDQSLLSSLEIPKENILEGFFGEKKTRFGCALDCIGKVRPRNRSRSSNAKYQRLKTMLRRHIDEMNRTRNVKAWNERIQTGVLGKSHKGRKVSVPRKVRECFQWQVTGQCSRGDSCSFRHK